MKKKFWLISLALTTGYCSTVSASAEEGRIFLSQGDRQLVMTTPVANQIATEDEINEAIARLTQNASSGAPTQSLASELVVSTGSSANLPNSAAPSIAAQVAARAAHSRSIGRCALYVRKALQSAGYSFTSQASAYMYANGTLASAGFTRIDSNNYVPQVGDVVVFNRTSKNPHGHIQIYDGSRWVSDFVQPKFSPYSQHNGYSVWRDTRYLDASSTNGTYLALNDQ